ncbi:MAG: TIGR02710 family CRISPR-associated CARF protein [Verrucomicrobiia bacterium]
MNGNQSYKAILTSVGGSPAPIIYIIKQHKPEHLWFFCSSYSREVAENILSEVKKESGYSPNARFIEVDQFETLGPCYLELRKKIPELLKEHKINPEEVLVDYTGGTKTMSAALVLAAMERFQNFSYVGGKERSNNGLGVVIDGKEKWLYQQNPWQEFAIREIERAIYLWNNYLFDAAAKIIWDISKKVPAKLRFEAIAEFATGTEERNRFNFKQAINHYRAANNKLPSLFYDRNDFGLIDFVKKSLQICQECEQENEYVILRELLDNCLRAAKQGRYDDATARLYRAMELQAQIWLKEKTDGAFKQGRFEKDISKLPEPLKNQEFCKPDRNNKIKLPLTNCILALNALGDKRVENIIKDMELGNKSKWFGATEKRNSSILAHSLKPVTEHGFNSIKQVASEFFGFDLEKEANPIPPMDERWFI